MRDYVKRSPYTDEYWAVMDVLGAHRYDYNIPTSKTDSPGWNACTCGWEGYWSEFHPHVTEQMLKSLNLPKLRGRD